MLTLLRQLGLLLVSGVLSYAVVLWVPPWKHGDSDVPEAPDVPLEVAVRPVIVDPPPVIEAEPEPEPEPVSDGPEVTIEVDPDQRDEQDQLEAESAEAAAEEEPAAAAAEASTVAPESEQEPATAAAAPEAGDPESLEEQGDPAGEPLELMADERYLEQARLEVSGDVRQGFTTTLLASPREVVDIARFFGEEVVLVPRSAIDPSNEAPHYFRIELGAAQPVVQRVNSRPPLAAFHRYHDLYNHQFADLPEAVRKLRVQVPSRSRVYIFAALIPVSEMALIVARREQALAASGREESEVTRFVLDYVSAGPSAYDIEVNDILFNDGSHFRPVPTPTTNR